MGRCALQCGSNKCIYMPVSVHMYLGHLQGGQEGEEPQPGVEEDQEEQREVV